MVAVSNPAAQADYRDNAARSSSAARLPLGATRRPSEQHAVMDKAEYLNHAVGTRPVDNHMSRTSDEVLRLDEATSQPERQSS